MKRKNIIGLWGAVSLFVSAASVGTVTAYMHSANEKTNHISYVGEKGIDAVLTEPAWQSEKGVLVVPNTIIPKDPQIQNISEIDLNIMAAIKAEFLYTEDCPKQDLIGKQLSAEDMKHLTDVYDIDWNSDQEGKGDWIRFDDCKPEDAVQYFYYKEILKRNYPMAGDRTKPLFTRLYIPPEITNEQYSDLQKIGGFDLKISGFIVQQMDGADEFGISTPKRAYEEGLFAFEQENLPDQED